MVFNLSFENATAIHLSVERTASNAIGKRMLFQLMESENWLEVPAMITPNDGKDRSSLFYSCMTQLSLLAYMGPFVINCCMATFSHPFHKVVGYSHQKRIYLPIHSLNPPQRQGKPVFANKPLLNMLVNDMGGHGRALEALEIAIKGKDLDNCNFAELMNEIRVRLVDRYSEWVCKSIYLKPVLQIILSQKTIHENFIIPETEIRIAELSQLGLVQFMNDEGETDQGRLSCPYIWIWIMANKSDDPILSNWNFQYYQECQSMDELTVPPGYQYWQHFEDFIARFCVLKSQLYGYGDNVLLEELHKGAKHNFYNLTITNKPLLLEKAVNKVSTKSSDTPPGDCFCPIYFTGTSQLCFESYQCKLLKNASIDQKEFNVEYEKAACDQDIFILFTHGSSNIVQLPLSASFSHLTAITGIGVKFASKIIEERDKWKFDNITDAITRQEAFI
nr:4513_t:CDS:2 [Entrophospora candida]